ncbi:hypothetical protein SLS60_000598 [Paraconiothyrium brasiliense]|uniref:Uncharacterized protein n=1 Tax=Paraconiothyrium brasiliense TaxID=300254 RepID=A0ABR3S869_9PLEO
MTALSTKLAALEDAGKPIHVALIGAGKFGSIDAKRTWSHRKLAVQIPELLWLSQAHRTKGVRLAAVVDLSVERAISALQRTGFPSSKYDINLSLTDGLKQDKTVITSDSAAMIAAPGIDVLMLKRDIEKDEGLSWKDVEFSEESQTVAVRREMERMYRKEFQTAGKLNRSLRSSEV